MFNNVKFRSSGAPSLLMQALTGPEDRRYEMFRRSESTQRPSRSVPPQRRLVGACSCYFTNAQGRRIWRTTEHSKN